MADEHQNNPQSSDESITIPVVTSRVKVLFVNHPELLVGFNKFLPTGFKISIPFTRKSSFDFEETKRFVNRVKEAFPHDEVRYASFLKLLNGHHNANVNIAELTGKVDTGTDFM